MKSEGCQLVILALSVSLTAGSSQSDALLNHVAAPDQPIRVRAVALDASGDVRIDIVNASSEEVRFVGFSLAAAECPGQTIKPLAVWVACGDWSAIDGESDKPPMPALPPMAGVTLTVPAATYQGILEGQVDRGCQAEARPELTLAKVAFCDGEGWEGFANGENHGTWSGRTWIPKGVPQNCS